MKKFYAFALAASVAFGAAAFTPKSLGTAEMQSVNPKVQRTEAMAKKDIAGTVSRAGETPAFGETYVEQLYWYQLTQTGGWTSVPGLVGVDQNNPNSFGLQLLMFTDLEFDFIPATFDPAANTVTLSTTQVATWKGDPIYFATFNPGTKEIFYDGTAVFEWNEDWYGWLYVGKNDGQFWTEIIGVIDESTSGFLFAGEMFLNNVTGYAEGSVHLSSEAQFAVMTESKMLPDNTLRLRNLAGPFYAQAYGSAESTFPELAFEAYVDFDVDLTAMTATATDQVFCKLNTQYGFEAVYISGVDAQGNVAVPGTFEIVGKLEYDDYYDTHTLYLPDFGVFDMYEDPWCYYFEPMVDIGFNVEEAIAGIDSVVKDVDNTNAPVEYFNIQGVRVENPTAGQLVIRRQGTDVKKMIVR